MSEPPRSPDRVVVFRALQLGDMLCATPALRALREALPMSRITLVGLPWAQSLVARLPHLIDEFIAFPGFPGLPERDYDPEEVTRFLQTLQERSFDLAVQLHGDGSRSNAIVALFGAKRMALFLKEEAQASPWLGDRPVTAVYPEEGHESQRLLSLPAAIAKEYGRVYDADSTATLEFPILPKEEARVRELLRAWGLTPGRYICVHPGARDPRRRTDERTVAELVKAIDAARLPIVVTGASSESQIVSAFERALVERTGDGPIQIVNAAALDLPLGEFAGLIAHSALIVTNDTGASHLAVASRTPSVVLFRASEPERWAPLDRERHFALDLRTERLSEAALHEAAAFGRAHIHRSGHTQTAPSRTTLTYE